MNNFDLPRYLGLWYEVRKYPFIFTIGGKCITANYGLNSDQSVSVLNKQIRNGKEESILGSARVKSSGVATLGVTFPTGPCERFNALNNIEIFNDLIYFSVRAEANYNVLFTDYDQFAVVYSCSGFLGLINAKSVWILSRTRIASPQVIEKAYEVLRQNQISTAFLAETDQRNCPEDIQFNTIDSFRN
jgi:apolipoprotein D and lipocalin family protein